jgi:hypothetical protein
LNIRINTWNGFKSIIGFDPHRDGLLLMHFLPVEYAQTGAGFKEFINAFSAAEYFYLNAIWRLRTRRFRTVIVVITGRRFRRWRRIKAQNGRGLKLPGK